LKAQMIATIAETLRKPVPEAKDIFDTRLAQGQRACE